MTDMRNVMNVILLSGGSGKRMWPLSNEIRSKQFLKVLKKDDGQYESMLQRVYRQINKIDEDSTVTIATGKSQVSLIHNQLGEKVGISVEPCRKDTFLAIVLAALFLADVKKVATNEPVVVCPVDPYVDEDYFLALKDLAELAMNDAANLVLLGMKPTCPSERYGYIIPCDSQPVSAVKTFKEKPSKEIAAEFISQGALWNGGVFAFRLDYVIKRAHELIDFRDYADLIERYDSFPKISFDHAVVEHEEKVLVRRFAGRWMDIGTWATITEVLSEPVVGKGIITDSCSNVSIINEMKVPVLAMGLKDVIIAASPDGILVSEKEQSASIKQVADKLEQPVMYAEKSWGSYRVVDCDEESMTIELIIEAGCQMSYHYHQNREEVWVIVSGEGQVIIDGQERPVTAGESIKLPVGCCHTIVAKKQMKIIEVQVGKEILQSDKYKM